MLTEDVRGGSPFDAVVLDLNSTLDDFEPKLRQLNEADVVSPRAAGKWSRKQIIGHLIDSASNNHQRFVRAQLQGEYDGPSYDQEGCVRVADLQSLSWNLLLDLFLSYNRYLAHVIARIPAKAADTRCVIGDKSAVALHFVASDYVRHLKQHLQQLGM
jgi:hypothetical protein